MPTAAQAALTPLHAASLVVALAAGCTFLLVGWRLLGLVAALAGATLGWWIAVLISAWVLPDASLLVAGIIGAVVGALLAAATLKLAIAGGAGMVGAVTLSVLALMLGERGVIPMESAAEPSGRTTVSSAPPSEQCALLLELGIAAAGGQLPANELVASARRWWQAAQPPVRTLLSAAALAGGVMAFALAMMAHKHASAACSAALGAALTLAAGLPLISWASGGAVAVPDQVMAWLLLGIALTIVGWVLQHRAMARAAAVKPKTSF